MKTYVINYINNLRNSVKHNQVNLFSTLIF